MDAWYWMGVLRRWLSWRLFGVRKGSVSCQRLALRGLILMPGPLMQSQAYLREPFS
jgi:hypothetical protein